MALTRRGIEYDLKESPYEKHINYDDHQIRYVFSSDYNARRFIERLYSNRDKINESLTNRFKIDIKMNVLSDIKLYESIEKRGFLIEYKGQKFTCLNSLKLDGNNLMKKS